MIGPIKTVSVFVEDQERAVAFYVEKLGFEVRRRLPMGPSAAAGPDRPAGAATCLGAVSQKHDAELGGAEGFGGLSLSRGGGRLPAAGTARRAHHDAADGAAVGHVRQVRRPGRQRVRPHVAAHRPVGGKEAVIEIKHKFTGDGASRGGSRQVGLGRPFRGKIGVGRSRLTQVPDARIKLEGRADLSAADLGSQARLARAETWALRSTGWQRILRAQPCRASCFRRSEHGGGEHGRAQN